MKFQNSITNKKILAKEFLYFTSLLAIVIVAYLSVITYNQIIDFKIDNQQQIKNKKEKIANDLVEKYNIKIDNQTVYFNSLIQDIEKKVFFIDDELRNEWWNRLSYLVKTDSIEYRWEHKWSSKLILGIRRQGYKSPFELKNFIVKNSPTQQEIKDFLLGCKIKREIAVINNTTKKYQTNKYNTTDQKELVLQVFIIAFSILFFLRYLKYGIVWSVKTLKEIK